MLSLLDRWPPLTLGTGHLGCTQSGGGGCRRRRGRWPAASPRGHSRRTGFWPHVGTKDAEVPSLPRLPQARARQRRTAESGPRAHLEPHRLSKIHQRQVPLLLAAGGRTRSPGDRSRRGRRGPGQGARPPRHDVPAASFSVTGLSCALSHGGRHPSPLPTRARGPPHSRDSRCLQTAQLSPGGRTAPG